MKSFCFTLIALACGTFFAPLSMAVVFSDKTNEPWSQKADGGPDKEVNGWYINLGITGARAKLIETNLNCLVITYIFANTPAHGKLQIGDIIVGVNNKVFETTPVNVSGVDRSGGEGTLMDFGNALEESQRKTNNKDKKPSSKSTNKDIAPGNGKLVLSVMRSKEKLVVVLDIGTQYGAYEDSYPLNCPKSDLILSELYPYLAKNQDQWTIEGRVFASLSLLASGDKKYLPNVKKAAEDMAAGISDKVEFSGSLPTWHHSFAGIVLAEYYLATGEPWVLPHLERVRNWLQGAQLLDPKKQIQEAAFPEWRTNPKDQERVIGGWGHNIGLAGYGPIAITSGQSTVALALISRCGINVNRNNVEKAYHYLDFCTNAIGYVNYGPSATKDTGSAWWDMGRTGVTAVANALYPYNNDIFMTRALLNARCIGEHVKSFPDTHASPILGMFWEAAAARIYPEGFKNLMTSHKWWFNLSHCPDGTFHYQPNRDNSNYSHGSRLNMTAAAAFIFSIKNKNLHITGAAGATEEFKIPELNLRPDLISRSTVTIYENLKKNKLASGQIAMDKLRKQLDEKSQDAKADKAIIEKDLNALALFQTHIDSVVALATERVQHFVAVGDTYQAQLLILQNKGFLAGLEGYDMVADPLLVTFKNDDMKAQLTAGREFYEALEKMKIDQKNAMASKAGPSSNSLVSLTKFIKKNPGLRYAEVAQMIVDELTKYPLASVNPAMYFNSLETK